MRGDNEHWEGRITHHEEVQHLARLADGEDGLHHNIGQLVCQLLLQLGAQAGTSHTPQQLPVVRLGVLLEALQERQGLLLRDLESLWTSPGIQGYRMAPGPSLSGWEGGLHCMHEFTQMNC